MKPKVSVAMITYGHEAYIARALDSILAQEVDFEYEVVIGEDCSPDNTRRILEEYREAHPGVIKPIFRETNIGMTANLYEVLTRCSGEYVAYLEGDDYWIDNKKLQKQLRFLEMNRNHIAVSHTVEMRDLDGKQLGIVPNNTYIVGKDVSPQVFLKGITYSFSSTMFRNFFLQSHEDKLKNIIVDNPTGDFTLCLLLLDMGLVHVMPDCMSVYQVVNRKGALNYNSSHSMMGECLNDYKIFTSNDEFYKGKYRFNKLYSDLLARTLVASLLEHRLNEYFAMLGKFPAYIKIMHFLCFPFLIIKRLSKRIKY